MHSVAKMARSKKIASAIFGRTLMEIYGAEAYAAFLPNTRRAFAGEFVRYERELQKPDGSAAWIAVNLSAHLQLALRSIRISSGSMPISC